MPIFDVAIFDGTSPPSFLFDTTAAAVPRIPPLSQAQIHDTQSSGAIHDIKGSGSVHDKQSSARAS